MLKQCWHSFFLGYSCSEELIIPALLLQNSFFSISVLAWLACWLWTYHKIAVWFVSAFSAETRLKFQKVSHPPPPLFLHVGLLSRLPEEPHPHRPPGGGPHPELRRLRVHLGPGGGHRGPRRAGARRQAEEEDRGGHRRCYSDSSRRGGQLKRLRRGVSRRFITSQNFTKESQIVRQTRCFRC